MKESSSRVDDAVVVATDILSAAMVEIAVMGNDIEKVGIGRRHTLDAKKPTWKSIPCHARILNLESEKNL